MDMGSLVAVFVVAVAGPCLLAWMTGRQRRAEELARQAREDTLAAAAKLERDQVAADLRETQAATAGKVAEVAEAVAATSATTGQRLTEIDSAVQVVHTLVNSNLTTAKENELSALRRMLVLLKETVRLNEALKVKPTTAVLAEIQQAEEDIARLSSDLRGRGDAAAAAAELGQQ